MQSTQPLVSILMCTYNGMPFVTEAIQSVVNQTFKDWELIICDDGSTDGTREFLLNTYSHDPRVTLFLHERNMGYVANKNFAHQQAKGTYLTQLDNDDRYHPKKLEKQIAVINKDKDVKMVACGYQKIDENGDVYATISSPERIINNHSEIQVYPFWFPALLVHKSVFGVVGYFNEYFSHALGDDVYWTVLANSRFPIYVLSEPYYEYRSNPNSITSNFRNVRKLVMPAMLRFLSDQIADNGSDWLQEGELEKIKALEHEYLCNRSYMAERFRMSAAATVDSGNKRDAWPLLWKALKRAPFSIMNYRTLLYLLKK